MNNKEQKLFEAVKNNKLYKIKKYVKEKNVNIRDYIGKTPIFYAKTFKVAKFLLDTGADINAQDINGNTIMHNENSLEMTELILEYGGDYSIKNYKNVTAMQANYNKINILTLIVKKNPDLWINIPHDIREKVQTKLVNEMKLRKKSKYTTNNSFSNVPKIQTTNEPTFGKEINNNFSYNNKVAATTSTFKIDYQAEQETTPFAETAIAGTIGFAAGAVGVALAAYGTKKIYDKFCNTQPEQNINESLEMNYLGSRQNNELTENVVWPVLEEITKWEQLDETERMLQNAIEFFDNERE